MKSKIICLLLTFLIVLSSAFAISDFDRVDISQNIITDNFVNERQYNKIEVNGLIDYLDGKPVEGAKIRITYKSMGEDKSKDAHTAENGYYSTLLKKVDVGSNVHIKVYEPIGSSYKRVDSKNKEVAKDTFYIKYDYTIEKYTDNSLVNLRVENKERVGVDGNLVVNGEKYSIINGDVSFNVLENPFIVKFEDSTGVYLPIEKNYHKNSISPLVVEKYPIVEIDSVSIESAEEDIHPGEKFDVIVEVANGKDSTHADARVYVEIYIDNYLEDTKFIKLNSGESETLEFEMNSLNVLGEHLIEVKTNGYVDGKPSMHLSEDIERERINIREKEEILPYGGGIDAELEGLEEAYHLGDEIEFTVSVEGENGSAVENADVYLRTLGRTGYKLNVGKTNSNGKLEVEYEIPTHAETGSNEIKVFVETEDYSAEDSEYVELVDDYNVKILTSELSREKSDSIEIEVTDYFGEPVEDAKVSVYLKDGLTESNSNIGREDSEQTVIQVIAGLPMRAINVFSAQTAQTEESDNSEYFVAEEQGDGVYVISYKPDYKAFKVELEVLASKDGNNGKGVKELDIIGSTKSLNLDIKNLFKTNLNRGQALEFSTIAEYNDSTKLSEGELEGEIRNTQASQSTNIHNFAGSVSDKRIDATTNKMDDIELVKKYAGRWDAEYDVPVDFPEGLVFVVVNGKDNLGNSGQTDTVIKISASYTVDILEPSSVSEFKRGEEVTVRAQVLDVNGEPVVGADVIATAPDGNSFDLNKESKDEPGVYEGSYALSQGEESSWSLKVSASKDGNYGEDELSFSILSSDLNVIITKPVDGETYSIGETVELEADVTYSSGKDVQFGEVTATGRDGNQIDFVYNSGVWSAEYVIKETDAVGNWNIQVDAQDIFGNSGSDSVGIVIETASELSGNMYTNLPNGIFTNINQTYEIYVDVTNNGESDAKDINVHLLDPVDGSEILSGNVVPISDLAISESGSALFRVQAPDHEDDEHWVAEVTYTDANSGEENTLVLDLNIISQEQAGGEDGMLEVVSMNVAPQVINAKGMNATVAVEVLNDGTAIADSVNISIVGLDSTIMFDVDMYDNLPVSLASGDSEIFMFNVSTTDVANIQNALQYVNVTAEGIDSNTQEVVESEEETASFYVDVVAPEINSNHGSSLIIPSGEDIEFEVTDDVAGVDGVWYNNGTHNISMIYISGNTYAIDTSNWNDGDVIDITIYANDTVSNENSLQNTIRVYVDDSQLTLDISVTDLVTGTTITSPAGGSFTGPSAFLNATTSSSAVCRFKVVSENQEFNNVSWSNMGTINNVDHSNLMTDLADGQVTVYVECNDTAIPQISVQENMTWNVDAEGPVIELLNETPIIILPGERIYFNVTDENALSDVWYNNGTDDLDLVHDSSSLYYIDTTGFVGGDYEIDVFANDTFGNENNLTVDGEDELNITVDDSDPVVQIVKPNTSETVWYNRNITINVSATDDGEVSQVVAAWYNGSDVVDTIALSEENGSWIAQYDSSALNDSTYNLTVVAEDSVGNTANDTMLGVRMDNIGPEVEILSPLSGSFETEQSVFVNATVNDTGVGVTDGSICRVRFGAVYTSTNLIYNQSTGICQGTVTVPGVSGTVNLVVEAEDDLDNLGSNEMAPTNQQVTVDVTKPYTPSYSGGGGSSGGSSGYVPQPEEPMPIVLEVEIEPDAVTVYSNETKEITVTVSNHGEEDLANLRLTLDQIPTSDYSASDESFTLKVGEEKDVTIAISPASISADVYEVRVTASNYKSGASNVFTLNVLEAETGDVVVEDDDQGTTSPITGMFVGLGEFVWTNWMWLLIAAAIGLTAYLNRGNIAKLFSSKKSEKKPDTPEKTAQQTLNSENKEKQEEKQEKDKVEWEFDWS